ncbi:hypothetical protein [Mucilaginibacter flavidus]|uniref:hypothetical protein n=1 Tax=Mucilaginibacter flavidus TaxID=2949309 RepID=UPI002092FBCA|nr:hypothetical protein [Mucilaginibacter flavidus]MCO5947120.1 hypothetical protein [Mucilaginibacter flavidus]
MSITVDTFSIDPQNITPARVALTVSYSGFADGDADNPVTVTLTLQDGKNVYIAETAISAEIKQLQWTETFPKGASGPMSKNIFVGIDPADAGNVCTVVAHFQPKSGGNGDDEQTHFNY